MNEREISYFLLGGLVSPKLMRRSRIVLCKRGRFFGVGHPPRRTAPVRREHLENITHAAIHVFRPPPAPLTPKGRGKKKIDVLCIYAKSLSSITVSVGFFFD